jgi:nitrate reductase NapA
MLKDGKLNFYWIQVNNNLQAAPNNSNETYPGYRNPDNFIVVSDAYPTVTAIAADLILPAAMWVEKEGAYGNAERRTHVWHQLVDAPGEARSDLWQLMEFSKRFTTDEVWPAEILNAKAPELSRQDALRCPVPQRQGRQVPLSEIESGLREPGGEGLRLLRPQGPVRGICHLRPWPWPRSRAL